MATLPANASFQISGLEGSVTFRFCRSIVDASFGIKVGDDDYVFQNPCGRNAAGLETTLEELESEVATPIYNSIRGER